MTVDRTLVSRFEHKYIVPASIVPAMRAYLRPFLRPDEFAAKSPDSTYSICSLYLDSNDFALYNATVRGLKNRFKLRIRSYTDEPSAPVFFEIKRRVNDVILKRRTRVERQHAAGLLSGQLPQTAGVEPSALPRLQEFLGLVNSLRAVPVIKVKYDREAYASRADDPVRITFDRVVRGAPSTDFDVSFTSGTWRDSSLQGVVLEIRFTDHFPSWVGEFIRRFQLQKCSVAKYILCANASGIAPRQGGPQIFPGPSITRSRFPWAR